MTDHVTQDQLNNHLVLIHQTIKDSNERTDKHLSVLSENLASVAKESAETRLEILSIVKSHETRLDAHGERLANCEQGVKVNNESRIKTGAYFGIIGVISAAVLGGIVKLLFFPAP